MNVAGSIKVAYRGSVARSECDRQQWTQALRPILSSELESCWVVFLSSVLYQSDLI